MVNWLALSPHPAGSFLCGVCFSLCLCGFCGGTVAFSQSPEAYAFSWLVIVKGLQCDCALVGPPKVEQVIYKSESWWFNPWLPQFAWQTFLGTKLLSGGSIDVWRLARKHSGRRSCLYEWMNKAIKCSLFTSKLPNLLLCLITAGIGFFTNNRVSSILFGTETQFL